MDYLIFGIVMLHLIGGFGWLFYKLEIQKEKPKNDDTTKPNPTNKQTQ
ncbi:MAG: hypothetical protein ABI549_07685 [Flavobacterium sp.]